MRVASLFSECAVRLRDATACRNVVTSVSSEEQVLLGVVGRSGTVVFLGRRQLAGLEATVLAQSADVRRHLGERR